MHVTPITLEVFNNKFASVAEEMGMTLCRTAYSPNIKERRDYSCAVFDAAGDMVAQAAHIPVHLGSMPLSVKAAMAETTFAPGDMVMLNDPFRGGTHLPDITLVAPVFAGGDTPLFFVANRAHHADVGGMAAGSMPLSTSIFQEGLIIPPVKIVVGGRVVPDVMRLFLANVRTPVEREGDFAAQIMANTVGAARLEALVADHGPAMVARCAAALMDYAERLVETVLEDVPDGTYAATDFLDDDGCGNSDLAVRLTLTVAWQPGPARFFGHRAPDHWLRQCRAGHRRVRGPVRLPLPGRRPHADQCRLSAARRDRDPARHPGRGRVSGRRGRGQCRDLPAAGGRDLLALAGALPERVPAASQGTMNNIALGGLDPRSGAPFAYYETLAGGAGASRDGAGQSAVHSHMTNTQNTPVEALEYAYPLRVTRYGLRPGSGGAGRNRGGDGLVREIELLAPAEVTVLSERRTRGAWGLAGGEAGAPGVNTMLRGGVEAVLPGKAHVLLGIGDRLRVATPGGGGYGAPDAATPGR